MSKKNSKYIRPFLLIAGLLCLCLAAITLIDVFSDIEIGPILNNNLIPLGILVQIVASMLFVLAWKKLLSLNIGLELGLYETSSHIGTTLLAKYIPGKIWGLVGRSYLLKTHDVELKASANLLLLDQVITFSSGICISVLFLSIVYLNFWAIGIVLPLAVLLNVLLKTYAGLTSILFKLIKGALQKLGNDITELEVVDVKPGAFYQVFLIYLVHWVVTAVALSILVYPLIAEDFLTNTLLITAAIPAAMLTGFIALWAPGGIGVRELVIVAILSLQVPLEVATFIAIAYRIICIGVDVVVGGISLAYFSGSKSVETP